MITRIQNYIRRNKLLALIILIAIIIFFFLGNISYYEDIRIKCNGSYSELSEIERRQCDRYLR